MERFANRIDQRSLSPLRRRSLIFLAAAMLALAPAADARAHPHVWIDAIAELLWGDDGALTGVRVYWAFDELYSAYAVEGLDADRDGEVEPAELAALAATNIENLKEFGYFTYLDVNGQTPAYGEVTDYGMRFVDGRLAMWFLVPLATPVDPRSAEVAFALYDPTFYIAIDLVDSDPVRSHGRMPEPCEPVIVDAKEHGESLSLSEAFFQNLGPATAFGAQFAKWVQLRCAPVG